MQFRTEIKGFRSTTEYLQCMHCNTRMFKEHEQCIDCSSEALEWFSQYTVYQVVYAKSREDAVDTAHDMDEWQVTGGKLMIEEVQ